MTAADPSHANPLLAYGALPRFADVEPAHVEPAIRALLGEAEAALEALEASAAPTWAGVVAPLSSLGERLGFAWGVIQHLMGVRNSDALREAHDAVQGDVVLFSLKQGQSKPIYDALEGLRASDAWAGLEPAQQRIADSLLRDMRHSGVGLEGEARERFNAIAQQQAELSTRFSNHVLDATGAFALVLRDPAEVDGLPQSALELAAQLARDAGDADATAAAGPWRITLDYPSFGPFMEHARRRDLREQLYRAYVTRASAGDVDNAPLIEEILTLRAEQAKLLGYPSFAELSLSTKMAPGVDSVITLLEQLREASIDAARDDLAALAEHARANGAAEADALANWDIAYWAERLREHRFAYSEEELRPYFPMPGVLDGLFGLAQRLFDVKIEVADGEAPVWHEDVRFFRVNDAHGKPVAAFYLDPYARSGEKRGGAWMDECVGRALAGECPGWQQLDDGVRLPVAYLVCNGTPPVGDRPSLMTFDEVNTLFHEFGHGLQHMLTRVDYGMAAGIRNIEWDAVELPSQFMENFCYQRETLMSLTRHVDTGEALLTSSSRRSSPRAPTVRAARCCVSSTSR